MAWLRLGSVGGARLGREPRLRPLSLPPPLHLLSFLRLIVQDGLQAQKLLLLPPIIGVANRCCACAQLGATKPLNVSRRGRVHGQRVETSWLGGPIALRCPRRSSMINGFYSLSAYKTVFLAAYNTVFLAPFAKSGKKLTVLQDSLFSSECASCRQRTTWKPFLSMLTSPSCHYLSPCALRSAPACVLAKGFQDLGALLVSGETRLMQKCIATGRLDSQH